MLQIAEMIDMDEKENIEPIITDDDLQTLGFTPGSALEEVKKQVFAAQEHGEFTDKVGGYQWIVSRIIEGAL